MAIAMAASPFCNRKQIMDMLSKARLRQTTEQAAAAGWNIDGSCHNADALSIWIYSFNLKNGARLAGRLSNAVYRSMRSGELIKEACGMRPEDNLGAALTHYDALPEDRRSGEPANMVLSTLAVYASITKTFMLIPKEIPGNQIHMMIFDWMTDKGIRIFRAGVAIDSEPLTPETLEEVSQKVLSVHLAKEPLERPI